MWHRSPSSGGSGSPRARCRRAGFSTLELVLAIGVILVAVHAAFSSGLSSNNLLRTSRETSTAMSDLQAAMESACSMVRDDLPVAGSEFEANQPVAMYEQLHLPDERLVASYPGYTPGGELPDPLVLVLTCTWRDFEGRERSLELVTVRSQ